LLTTFGVAGLEERFMFISRGYKSDAEAAPADMLSAAPPPQSVDYHLVHDRLSMLERLTALRAAGTLGEEEFLAEKERILALPGEELVLRPTEAARVSSPSLFGRLFSWKLLALGVLLGLAIGLFTRPNQAVHLLGLAF
jgi:hypothetical protein